MTGSIEPIVTRVAHAGFDDHRFFGHRVFAELTGQTSIAGLAAMAVSGRQLDPLACSLLDDIACLVTMADPRIWPLKVARLVAVFGSAVAGFAAGVICCDTAFLGPRVASDTAEVLVDLRVTVGEAWNDAATVGAQALHLLDARGRLPGFGVPFRGRDERLVAFHRRLEQRGWKDGEYLTLARAMALAIEQKRGIQPNVALGVTAALLDLGFGPADVGPMMTSLLHHTLLANAVEEARLGSASLRRLPPAVVQYRGPGPRLSPAAQRCLAGSGGA